MEEYSDNEETVVLCIRMLYRAGKQYWDLNLFIVLNVVYRKRKSPETKKIKCGIEFHIRPEQIRNV